MALTKTRLLKHGFPVHGNFRKFRKFRNLREIFVIFEIFENSEFQPPTASMWLSWAPELLCLSACQHLVVELLVIDKDGPPAAHPWGFQDLEFELATQLRHSAHSVFTVHGEKETWHPAARQDFMQFFCPEFQYFVQIWGGISSPNFTTKDGEQKDIY